MMQNRKAVYLTTEELSVLQHIMYHFTDYMAYDDRPDHGFGILKGYRDLPPERKTEINILAGRLRRLSRKWQLRKETV